MTFDLLCLREYENGGVERVLSGVDVTDEDNVDKLLSVQTYIPFRVSLVDIGSLLLLGSHRITTDTPGRRGPVKGWIVQRMA